MAGSEFFAPSFDDDVDFLINGPSGPFNHNQAVPSAVFDYNANGLTVSAPPSHQQQHQFDYYNHSHDHEQQQQQQQYYYAQPQQQQQLNQNHPAMQSTQQLTQTHQLQPLGAVAYHPQQQQHQQHQQHVTNGHPHPSQRQQPQQPLETQQYYTFASNEVGLPRPNNSVQQHRQALTPTQQQQQLTHLQSQGVSPMAMSSDSPLSSSTSTSSTCDPFDSGSDSPPVHGHQLASLAPSNLNATGLYYNYGPLSNHGHHSQPPQQQQQPNNMQQAQQQQQQYYQSYNTNSPIVKTQQSNGTESMHIIKAEPMPSTLPAATARKTNKRNSTAANGSPSGNGAKREKKPGKKRRDPNEPQKPVSAYALFFRDTQATIKGGNPNASFGEVSKIVASMWDSLDPTSKFNYKKKTEQAKKEYLKALASYRASLLAPSASPAATSPLHAPGLVPSGPPPQGLPHNDAQSMQLYVGVDMGPTPGAPQQPSPLQMRSPLLTSALQAHSTAMFYT